MAYPRGSWLNEIAIFAKSKIGQSFEQEDFEKVLELLELAGKDISVIEEAYMELLLADDDEKEKA